jgi:predicted secreted protein
LTGLIAGAGSLFVLRVGWVTTLVSMGVLLWWLVFLVLVPAAYRQQRDSSEDN